MLVARILYPVEVLGPGKRIGIWMCGCKHGCEGCSNPELWEFDDKYEISVNDIFKIIYSLSMKYRIDGFTITGGDPFEQVDKLSELIERIKAISSDILIYTGYTLEELKGKNKLSITNVLGNIAVLIDGRYIEKRNNNVLLRGSDNQKVHILNSAYKERYEKYLSKGANKIQNFKTIDGIISVGIHKPGFIKQLDDDVKKFGLQKGE
ncbi:4Fe-4S single cluster domain-containing protein [Clostridium drakei]|uniref:Radical SAM protein n=1 Tax=Clostridium drakei TaxID=332101 RepID=A0A2U8DQI0_9CLOT|nr:4Fe-4S single cluster domain-containing protein [Clostridium drakei]AWI05027.1 radical SAM protein [Clostridium drakei]